MAIHLILPDTEANRLLAKSFQSNGWAEIAESDDSLQLASVDERMKHAMDCLKQEGKLAHKYDPVWIMQFINEGGIKEKLTFYSVPSFRNYLLEIGVEDVAGVSTLSQYKNTIEGKFPDWTFTDTEDAFERVRRVNIARRFSSAYVKGK